MLGSSAAGIAVMEVEGCRTGVKDPSISAILELHRVWVHLQEIRVRIFCCRNVDALVREEAVLSAECARMLSDLERDFGYQDGSAA